MGIYKRKSPGGESAWGIDYYDSAGRRIKRIVGNKRQAEIAWAKIQSEKFEENILGIKQKPKILFREFANTFTEYSAVHSCFKSHETNLSALKTFVSSFSEKFLDEISLKDIDAYIMMRLKVVKPSSVNRNITVLKRMLNLAEEWGFLIDNIGKKIRKVKESAERIRYLSMDELNRLLGVCKQKQYLYTIVMIALNTGMRKGEILSLTWGQIDFENRFIHLEITKSSKRRDIPMNQHLYTALIEWKKATTAEALFCIKDIKKAFHSALKKADIVNFRFHDLRHTFASHLIMKGVDLTTVSRLMGHSSIEMTMRYTHLSIDHRRNAVEKIGEMIEKQIVSVGL